MTDQPIPYTDEAWEAAPPGSWRSTNMTTGEQTITLFHSEPAVLEIDPWPTVECSVCQFQTGLQGTWTIEDGRLVFRADPDPLTSRGPDFFGCAEGSAHHHIVGITINGERLSDTDFDALTATAIADQDEHGLPPR